MTPSLVLFWVLAILSVGAAVMMVNSPNPVRSALFLVVTFLCIAAFYVTLSAQFIAAVQIIVYAGAIMVLFLFVIMLLNLGAPEALRERGRLQTPAAIALGAAFIVALILSQSLISLQPPRSESASDAAVIAAVERKHQSEADLAGLPAIHRDDMGTTQTIGLYLFSPKQPWLFPFEITS